MITRGAMDGTVNATVGIPPAVTEETAAFWAAAGGAAGHRAVCGLPGSATWPRRSGSGEAGGRRVAGAGVAALGNVGGYEAGAALLTRW